MPTAITHEPIFNTPVSSTNTAVVRWSGTTGATLQDSGVLIDGSNNLIIPAQGDLRLSDTTGGQYVALQAAGTTTSHTLTLPATQGSASTFLQNNGSGALSWAAAGGGSLTFIETITASGASTVTFDSGITDTYDAFLLVGSEIKAGTHSASLYLRCGDSSGVDSGSTDYMFSIEYLQAGSTSHTQYSSTGANHMNVLNYLSSQTDSYQGAGFNCWVYKGGGTSATQNPIFSGSGVSYYGSNMIGGTFIGARKADINLARVQVVMNAGTVSGRFTLWGLKHS